MSLLFTLIDSPDTSNSADGLKHIRGTFSFTNPYTALGEVITQALMPTGTNTVAFSTLFPHGFVGGQVLTINPSVTLTNTGIVASGRFRGDTSSVSTAVFQLFNNGLSGTAAAGLMVDNTVANISGTTCNVELWGW